MHIHLFVLWNIDIEESSLSSLAGGIPWFNTVIYSAVAILLKHKTHYQVIKPDLLDLFLEVKIYHCCSLENMYETHFHSVFQSATLYDYCFRLNIYAGVAVVILDHACHYCEVKILIIPIIWKHISVFTGFKSYSKWWGGRRYWSRYHDWSFEGKITSFH